MLLGDWQESEDIADFMTGQLFELVFRFFAESFINGFVALLWPLLLIDELQLLGVGLLVAGYFVFERLIKPGLEAWFPEDNGIDG